METGQQPRGPFASKPRNARLELENPSGAGQGQMGGEEWLGGRLGSHGAPSAAPSLQRSPDFSLPK